MDTDEASVEQMYLEAVYRLLIAKSEGEKPTKTGLAEARTKFLSKERLVDVLRIMGVCLSYSLAVECLYYACQNSQDRSLYKL